MRLTFKSGDSIKQMSLLSMDGHHLICWDLKRTNGGRRRNSALSSLPHCWAGTSHLILSFLWMELKMLAPLVLRFSGLNWSFNTSFPGSLACRRQIMRLLSLHNHMSQYLIAKLSLSMYTCIMFVCVCVCVCDRFSINIMSFNVVLLCYRTENRVEQVSLSL